MAAQPRATSGPIAGKNQRSESLIPVGGLKACMVCSVSSQGRTAHAAQQNKNAGQSGTRPACPQGTWLVEDSTSNGRSDSSPGDTVATATLDAPGPFSLRCETTPSARFAADVTDSGQRGQRLPALA
jgi:hypothetical protein